MPFSLGKILVQFSCLRLSWCSIDVLGFICFLYIVVFFSWANGLKKVSNEGVLKATQ